ncbi:MAG: methylmalonyl-CoA mutase family protein [Deltaproteobacteria bacterium]|nr:methylmalonyl-CoA mutase family protein [Deltaproteobacteria bacterium]
MKKELGDFFKDIEKRKLRKSKFTTMSGIGIDGLYLPEDPNEDYFSKLGLPGSYPYTRGIHPTMYREKVWTMRMFAGFGTPEDTNRRFKYLLQHGQTGLSTAFDMPTLMGYDPDHPLSRGEIGKEGVSVASIEDMRVLFDGIPLDRATTSMTINAPAIVLLAFYVANAENQGVSADKLGGTTQNDILKEFIAQKEWISPPRPSMRIIQDMLVFCSRHMPKWNTISISGYHIREAGATAVQELAFTLADGIGYVQAGIEAGLDVDEFAQRLSFFFDVHNDFFEEIAKFRAARRIWSRVMKERFGAKNERSWLLRTHAQTAGVSLTAQQPYNNVVRTTIQALAAVLGGTQSLHTNSLDETYALPSENAAKIALRTQQIIAEESGISSVVDPLGGSFFLERLTDQMEAGALDYINKIDEMGGIILAIEKGFPQKEIAESAYQYQKTIDSGERIIVGVNGHKDDETPPIEILKIDPEVERLQIERIGRLRKSRHSSEVNKSIAAVKRAAESGSNLMYPIIAARRDIRRVQGRLRRLQGNSVILLKKLRSCSRVNPALTGCLVALQTCFARPDTHSPGHASLAPARLVPSHLRWEPLPLALARLRGCEDSMPARAPEHPICLALLFSTVLLFPP